MEDFKKHIYCYECEEFRRSTCGYYASCNKKAKDNGVDLDSNQNLIGIKFSTDSYDYCVDGKKKIKENTINKDKEKEQKMIDEFIETRERFIKSEEIFLSYLKSRL
jgi:hypothetical protein